MAPTVCAESDTIVLRFTRAADRVARCPQPENAAHASEVDAAGAYTVRFDKMEQIVARNVKEDGGSSGGFTDADIAQRNAGALHLPCIGHGYLTPCTHVRMPSLAG